MRTPFLLYCENVNPRLNWNDVFRTARGSR